ALGSSLETSREIQPVARVLFLYLRTGDRSPVVVRRPVFQSPVAGSSRSRATGDRPVIQCDSRPTGRPATGQQSANIETRDRRPATRRHDETNAQPERERGPGGEVSKSRDRL